MKELLEMAYQCLRMITGLVGLILCSSEAVDPANQIYISLAGIALLILAALPALLRRRNHG